MRKLLMLVTMLLVPALANAWTLAVKVTNTTAGIGAGNKATVNIGAGTDVTAGTKYFYPTAATVTVDVANTATVSLVGGGTLTDNGGGSYTIEPNAAKTIQTLSVVYPTAATVAKANLSVVQTPGGMTQLQIGSSSTVKGFTGVPVGTVVTVKTNASTGYSLSSVDLNGSPLTAVAGVYSFAVANATADVVTAFYTKDAVVTGSLAMIQSGPAGTPVTATVTVTGPATFAWTVNGVAQGSTTNTMTFTPVIGANMVQVTLGGAAVPVVKSASFMGFDAGLVNNYSCTACHSGSTPTIVANYQASAHAENAHSTCEACHTAGSGTPHNSNVNTSNVSTTTFEVMSSNISGLANGSVYCTKCHTGAYPIPHATTGFNTGKTCSGCHTSTTGVGGTKDAHGIQSLSCIGCHSVAQAAPFAPDNTGVRSITNEFGKWSHHVTGVTLQDAHCAACHLAGKVSHGGVVVDGTKHMIDNITHLRNADTDADIQWDPTAPSYSNMDTFCLTCHDSDGATSAGSAAIQAVIIPATGKTASASNPFGDTISNQYDMEERPAVVDAKSQFNTNNYSHHAVLGKKYTGRTRVAGDPRSIASPATFAINSSATLPGERKTIYDAGKFQADYTTLGDALGESGARNGGTTLGDDSTLHCGDCHTVGQYSTTQSDYNTRYNKAVIGAHGSDNEYMLRNNVGTDARHQGLETVIAGGNADNGTIGTKPYLVCFNCHAFTTYGTVTSNNGETGVNHAGEYTKDERCNGPYNTIFGNMTGEHRLRSMVTATSLANYGQFVGGGKYFGNMFGIQCANCHNSGVKDNLFGGIHGSKVGTYVDGMGNNTKHYRFLPGLGNAMFVPGVKGGFAGGTNATYKAYSGNRNGTGAGNSLGQTWSLLPVRAIRVDGVDNANGSYTYVTGGASLDLNWEQRTQQPIKGQTDLQSKAMGCYTITPDAPNYTYSGTGAFPWKTTAGSAPTGQQKNPKVLALQAGGYPADDIRNAATTGLTAGDGREVFDVWGGCDDHNGAQGAGTGIVRKTLRKVSY